MIKMAYQKKPIRRNQLISPWGIGAIVPFPYDQSVMIAGLDMWRYNNKEPFIINDKRLTQRLQVQELRWPPDFRERSSDPENYNLKIPAVKFPRWHYCPYCGTMQKLSMYSTDIVRCSAYQWEKGASCDPKKKIRARLIPERFVVVCPEGHIDDFPIIEWLHDGEKYKYDERTCRIRRSTGGTSAALTGVYYECSCGAKRSIAPATRPGALEKIGYVCKGAKPWLGIEEESEPCNNKDIQVIQRGASNIWFPNTISSIFIPMESISDNRRIHEVAKKYLSHIEKQLTDGHLNYDLIKVFAQIEKVDEKSLIDTFEKIVTKRKIEENVENHNISEEDYRYSEYEVLKKDSGAPHLAFYSKNLPIIKFHSYVGQFFSSISLVHKLKETRALIGFSRLVPGHEKSISDNKKMLSIGKKNWLPAIEVHGEGLFFEFNQNYIEKWAKKQSVMNRIGILNRSYKESVFGKHSQGTLKPEFVLIHTFSHLIINQLSFETGYGSSSIRERIYCDVVSNTKKMYGVLLYTASGDSDGSMGGLVRRGMPGRIEDTVSAAIENAKWCSADPICIESLGQGPESCNLAACHSCALLPETSCDHGNRLLDRALVIGTLEDPSIGYFTSD